MRWVYPCNLEQEWWIQSTVWLLSYSNNFSIWYWLTNIKQKEAVSLCACSKAKRLAIGFSKRFLTQHHTLHSYSYFYTKLTIDRRASPNPNNVQRIKPQTQRSENLCTEWMHKNQCIGKPHWVHKESMHKKTTECTKKYRLNTQRKCIGCTKETNVIQIAWMHK